MTVGLSLGCVNWDEKTHPLQWYHSLAGILDGKNGGRDLERQHPLVSLAVCMVCTAASVPCCLDFPVLMDRTRNCELQQVPSSWCCVCQGVSSIATGQETKTEIFPGHSCDLWGAIPLFYKGGSPKGGGYCSLCSHFSDETRKDSLCQVICCAQGPTAPRWTGEPRLKCKFQCLLKPRPRTVC